MKPLQVLWLIFTAGVTAWVLSTCVAPTSKEVDLEPIPRPWWAARCPDGTEYSINDKSFKGCPTQGPAANVTTVPVKRLSVILPPPEYDHYFEGDLTIRLLDTFEELWALCGRKEDFLLGCTYPDLVQHKSCIILMVNDTQMRRRGWTTGIILRHEMGHCNGWGGDHLGQRALPPDVHWLPPDQRVKVPFDRQQKAEQVKAAAP